MEGLTKPHGGQPTRQAVLEAAHWLSLAKAPSLFPDK